MNNPFTEHPQDTTNPQTYWEHGRFGGWSSLKLIYGGIVGLIHAVFPWWFKFTTSTIIIKGFKRLVDSRRHGDEFKQIMPKDYIYRRHID